MNEQGIWIVYTLESNRMIQELLMKEKIPFKFYPKLNILKNDIKDDET